MRRLLIGPIRYLRNLGRDARAAWDQFAFAPADPTPLGVVRVAAGALAFWTVFVYGLDLHAYLGSDGWMSPMAVRQAFEGRPAAWSFWWLVPDGLLRPAWVACLVILALFTVGLWSRVTAVLAWAIVVSTARRAPASLYGFDQINSTWLLYLAATGASGRAVSLDRFLARFKRHRLELVRRPKSGQWTPSSGVPEPSVAANLALRLIQCHLVFIYAMAALAKFQGQAWWTGNAFWGIAAAGEFRLFDLTWLAAYPTLIQLFTHTGLALELGYPVLVWVRPIRPLMMTLIVLMHVGIGLTLGLTEFSLAMIAGNLAFCDGRWLRSLVAGREPGKPAGRVLYDGACPRCRASMALITAGDPDRLVEPVDLTSVDVAKVHPSLTKESCLRAMHLVRADGRVESGYDAVMTVLGWTPPFWPLSLVRHVPGISAIGRRVYRAIADSRPRDAVCNDEVCGLHPHTPADRAKTGRAAR
ncbi:MAG TPA: DCC1-like thiol-disulfide oxidoreductase family protein [Isosphaeraceae bacterium]